MQNIVSLIGLFYITEFSALNSSTLTMKRDCQGGEQKVGFYGTATLIKNVEMSDFLLKKITKKLKIC